MAEVIFTLESILNFQEKTNDLFEATTIGKTIFGKMVDMFSFTTKNTGEKVLQQNGAPVFKDKVQINCFGSIIVFRAKEIEKATKNAQNETIGKGGYGTLHKGVLPDKRVVAIKIHIILGTDQLEPFINEVVILEAINHENVVQLLGCCLENEVACLVYEFITAGSLHNLIHNETSGAVRLSWDSRSRIAHESARALAYLHTNETMPIIHGDVKSANILLDENYTAKISDFGSSLTVPLDHDHVTHFQGTIGYIDPEYFNTWKLTDKSDVYSFGVVLAELLTGKKPIDGERDEYRHLATDFSDANMENRLYEILDPHVLEDATDEQLSATCDLVCRCLEPLGVNRPSMKEVATELESLRLLGKNPWISQDNY